MVSPADRPTEVPVPTGRPLWGLRRARHFDDPATGECVSRLVPSALAFATRCHAVQRRRSDGARFIEHPLEVAGLLHEAGCSDVLVAAGLLHSVLEDAGVSVAELTARFGAEVATLVKAVSSDASIRGYRERKRMLCAQVRNATRDAALLFAADKVSKVRELPNLVRGDRTHFDAKAHKRGGRDLLEHDYRMRLEHYHESLQMVRGVAPGHPLVIRLAKELDNCRWCLGAGEQQSVAP